MSEATRGELVTNPNTKLWEDTEEEDVEKHLMVNHLRLGHQGAV